MSHEAAAAECEVVITRSGARAMRDVATGELMHPIVGPLAEAEQLYLKPSRLEERLAQAGPEPLVLLDVGLGAGSNAVAAWRASERAAKGARRLAIASFDRTLAALSLALEAEHAASFGFTIESVRAARALIQTGSDRTERTDWRLVTGELPEILGPESEESADIVFWDPFSPRANPSLWTVRAFRAVRRLCRSGATLHTYSAATMVRSALLLAGFAVGVGEPTSAEKQTTMAAVNLRDLARPLDRRWLERLGRSSAPFPADAPLDALAQVAGLAQFSP